MKITVVGTGYVGLVTGTCFSETGNHVTCVDTDESKLNCLMDGIVPIHEPGLEELVIRNIEAGRLNFSTRIEDSLNQSSIVFIAVGTPPNEDGSADLSHVLSVAQRIGNHMTQPILVVNKSTVPVGTADQVRETISKVLRDRNLEVEFEVVSNPEFLKEGAAVQDFMSPDRIIVGCSEEHSMSIMRELYGPFSRARDKLQFMGVRDAEMTKYAANAMLATKISFMNEIALMCEAYHVDVENVRKGMGSDARIGYSFIYPGAGYGGSCFPKDVRALTAMAEAKGIEPRIMESVEIRNNLQKLRMFEKVVNQCGESLKGLHIAVWGLAFKPETDDVREAPALLVIEQLVKAGASVATYDPEAMENARADLNLDNVAYCSDMYNALNGADALIVMTEWKEFRQPDFEKVMSRMRSPRIFDGRNVYDPKLLSQKGFFYEGVGRK